MGANKGNGARHLALIEDNKEAMKEFSQCKEGQFVYSTNHEQIVIEVVKYIGIRRSS